jgi:hypothetical protein
MGMKTELADICPEIIIKADTPKKDDAKLRIIPLLPSSNTANLTSIVFDVRDPVLLRLLVCKEELSTNGTDNCLYPEHKNNEADRRVCINSEKKLAHIYVRHNQVNKETRSFVIAFIEGKNLHKIDEILTMLENTVDWLDIAKERPFFYVIRYGQPVISITTNQTRIELAKRIKGIYKGYPDNEDTCIVLSSLPDSRSLIIEHIRKFSIKIS